MTGLGYRWVMAALECSHRWVTAQGVPGKRAAMLWETANIAQCWRNLDALEALPR